MINPITFPCLNSGAITCNYFNCRFKSYRYPVFEWLLCGKIPENPVITPSTTTQVVRPSAKNKFLQSVTVKATTTTPTP